MRAVMAAFLLLISCEIFGQPQTSSSFEVVSIKQAVFESPAYFDGFSSAGTCNRVRILIAGNRVTLERVTLCGLIRTAYDVQHYQISAMPDWMTKREQSIFYNIDARSSSNVVLTTERAVEMLRTLLADRFQLKFHYEPREVPVYALVVNKGRPTLALDSRGVCAARQNAGFVSGPGLFASCRPNTTMSQLADVLGRETDRPVLDRTGITGQHAFELRWASQSVQAATDSLPSLFTAVQEQS
jgi:uncharacterized protein (TIGR03435 family)